MQNNLNPHRIVITVAYYIPFLLILSLLASCATLPQFSVRPPDEQLWQRHQQSMLSLSSWELRGKLAMHYGNNGGQADVFWQQTDAETFEIRLVAPFGAGSSLLTSRPGQVRLTTSDGESLVADNIQSLLTELPDWQFPVSGLRYWLFGIASPLSAASRMNWDEQGWLAMLEQDGWHIELQNYAVAGTVVLPRKIIMHRLDRDDVDLKLVVREWSLP